MQDRKIIHGTQLIRRLASMATPWLSAKLSMRLLIGLTLWLLGGFVVGAETVKRSSAPSSPASQPELAPMSDFQKGVSYATWARGDFSSARSDETLSHIIKPMNVNWISLIVTCYQEKLDSTVIHDDANESTGRATATDEDLRHVIRVAHGLGIRVMLKPHIDLSDDAKHWRGEIKMKDDEDAWKAWFESYTQFITRYAALAREFGVDSFAVGTELLGTSRRSDQWRSVIRSVRQAYSGPLVYAANWGEEVRVDWWDAVDAIGVDAYYPLFTKVSGRDNPAPEKLVAAWAPYVSRLENLSRQWDRPIILTEIGYRSIQSAHRDPANWRNTGEVDLEEQANCYQAVFEAFKGKPWWRGVFWWNWTPDPAQGGPKSTDFTANSKPAENILRKYYGAVPRAIEP